MTDHTLPQWHYLFGEPTATATIRAEHEHFQVDEQLPFTPDGAGEHHLLHIEKRDLTTHQLAKMVARFADVPARDVSWAGLKDRHGITRQWLSVRIPGKVEPNWAQLNDDNITLLSAQRHSRKLRTGTLLGNRFKIALSNVNHAEQLIERLAKVSQGVPNYYGEQRFGHGGMNVRRAVEMFAGRKVKDRNKRGIYLSAVRSFLFNHIVSARLAKHDRAPLDGDVVMLANSNSFFVAEQWDAEHLGRLLQGDIELSAPLAGDGELESALDAAAFEQSILAQFPELMAGLSDARMAQDRRRLLLKPTDLKHYWQDDLLWLEFGLPAGAFATSILREIVDYQDAQAFEHRQSSDDRRDQANDQAGSKQEPVCSDSGKQASADLRSETASHAPVQVGAENKPLTILISNDDGVQAPGIKALTDALATIAQTVTVAPDRNCSGASNSLTLTNPLRAQTLENGYIQVNGTPTDCVHLAIRELLDEEPALVVSGINAGANLGDDTLYSGTVAAAMEGRHLGLPTVAVSLVGRKLKHYATAAAITVRIVNGLLADPLPKDQILNVNVPDLPLDQIKGIQITRLGARHKAEGMVKTCDPAGREIYWIGPLGEEADAGEGTDFYAVANGYVSVTPLTVDLTAHSQLPALRQWCSQL